MLIRTGGWLRWRFRPPSFAGSSRDLFNLNPTKTRATPGGAVRGFTLIEILVILVILAILAALLFPALSTARRDAQMAGCTSNLHQIGLALQMYKRDWNALPLVPPHAPNPNAGPSLKGPDSLYPHYLSDTGVYHCPASWRPSRGPAIYEDYFYLGSVYFEDVPEIAALVERPPNSTVLFCPQHTSKNWPFLGEGTVLALRMDGSVQRVPAPRVSLRVIGKDGREADGGPGFYIFPGDPWPANLEWRLR